MTSQLQSRSGACDRRLIFLRQKRIVGTVDLLNALRQPEVPQHLQSTWYIPTFWVPVLLVTHALIFVRLLKQGR